MSWGELGEFDELVDQVMVRSWSGHGQVIVRPWAWFSLKEQMPLLELDIFCFKYKCKREYPHLLCFQVRDGMDPQRAQLQ